MSRSTLTIVGCFVAAQLVIAAPTHAQTTPSPSQPPPELTVTPYTFVARNGTKVEAELGAFTVPENRANPASRQITLRFVRFKSTSSAPGSPIVYLAGGPGGSGISTATGARFPIFMALRAVADVIAFDQRGTGKSNDIPRCADSSSAALATVLTRASMTDAFRSDLSRCFAEWSAQGVDIDGYTTLESAHDLDDLRRALGVPRISLWGISYGSHLGLATIKYHESSIDRAVFAGIEGLDQTVKRPSMTDSLFARVQRLINEDANAKSAYPDLAGMMRRVHARMNEQPVTIALTDKDADRVTVDAFPLQLFVGGMISDPAGIAAVPTLYRELDRGNFGAVPLRMAVLQFRARSAMSGMPEAMDIASGISSARLTLIADEAKRGLLGDALNFPMPHALGVRPSLDLGDAFRAPVVAATPTLFVSGTLDGRTAVPEAREEIRGFRNGTHLVVENGGHNIYEADQRVADAVLAFFRGEVVPTAIPLEPPRIVP